jgi:O-acetyl-ADP-ribose deacetylase (regulator of RNase III)
MMRVQVKSTLIELVQDDITRQDTEAIVNAANNSLLGGGGVDGAIHRAAGPGLLAETRTLGGCDTGDARLTQGYNLKARYIIHTVGPVYNPHEPEVPQLLRSAYHRSLQLALERGIQSIAFPAVSTGVYGYPLREAAEIALDTVIGFVSEHEGIALVRFVLFDDSALQVYETVLKRLVDQKEDLRIV